MHLKFIFDGNLIQCLIIETHLKASICLFLKQNKGIIRSFRRMNESNTNQLFQFFPQFSQLY
jgi:hypothetical protein